MEIVLNVKLDEADNKYFVKYHVDEESLLNNHDNFLNLVSGNCNDYSFKVIKELMFYYVDPEKGKVYKKYEDQIDSLELKLLIKDFLNSESCLNRILSNIHDYDDVSDLNERKVLLLQSLIKDFIECVVNDHSKRNDNNYNLFASYYIPYKAYFKYPLPLEIMKKYVVGYDIYLRVDLTKLTAKELCKYVLPYYYQDLGMWYSETIRNDVNLMNKLTLNWLELSKDGSLD